MLSALFPCVITSPLFCVEFSLPETLNPQFPNFLTMPQKRKKPPPPVEDPPSASSSESEEDDHPPHSSQPHAAAKSSSAPKTSATPKPPPPQLSSSGEEDDSSQEEDEDQPSPLPAPANPPSNAHPKLASSESESETDSEPTRAKSQPKTKPSDQPQPQVQPGSKRPAHITEPKRSKKKPSDAPSPSLANDMAEEDRKKSGVQGKLFQRIWSQEDELGILKGMADFISKTGQDPYKYPDAFHNFIKKSLHVEFSGLQLKEKTRRMKKKFLSHMGKVKNGVKPRFLKPHDKALFELSKKIWGEWPNGLVEKPKLTRKPADKTPKKESAKAKEPSQPSEPLLALPAPEKHDGGDVSFLYRNISCFQELDADEMKKGLSLIGESKRKELERRWNVLRHSEMELLANRFLLIGEQMKLVSEALQSSSK